MAMQQATETKIAQIGAWARAGDRLSLQKMLTPSFQPGTLRIADVRKVGPANPNKFKLPVKTWDNLASQEDSDGRCKGRFCAAFGRQILTIE